MARTSADGRGDNTSGDVNAVTHQHQTALNRTYTYDALGNRTISAEGTGGGTQTTEYTPRGRYTWDLDLSGSLQGAGGIGGFLEVKATNGLRIYRFHDSHGNITSYSDMSTGVLGHHEPSRVARALH